MRGVACGLVGLVLLVGCGDGGSGGATSAARRTAQEVERLRGDPQRLTELFRRMPKGADLHSHLTGAAATESLIDWGIADGLCLDATTFTAAAPPCGAGQIPMRDAATDPDLYQLILEAWSMEGFAGTLLERHAHFFATFARFNAAAGAHITDIFVEQKREAARDHIAYLEIMSSFGSGAAIPIGLDHLPAGDTWTPEYLLAARAAIVADPRFAPALASGESFIAETFDAVDAALGCGTPAAEPACDVELRLQVTGNRAGPRAAVFAQFVFGFELAQRDDRFVAINLVSPEEDPNSLAFYDDEMLAAGTLRELYASNPHLRTVHVSLHAGELIPAVLPDTPEGQEQLTFHIRHAVEIGRADRIGHGVDLAHEMPATLLPVMRQRQVMVEINLTSNALLLGVEGQAHPLHRYLAHGVPVALSTDDEGVLRTDLTDQYVRAVTVQGLGYPTLKRMARNALEFSFAPGESVWRQRGRYRRTVAACADVTPGAEPPPAACAAFLGANVRARLQWAMEGDLAAFEESVGR